MSKREIRIIELQIQCLAAVDNGARHLRRVSFEPIAVQGEDIELIPHILERMLGKMQESPMLAKPTPEELAEKKRRDDISASASAQTVEIPKPPVEPERSEDHLAALASEAVAVATGADA